MSLFDQLDRNGDGVITREELASMGMMGGQQQMTYGAPTTMTYGSPQTMTYGGQGSVQTMGTIGTVQPIQTIGTVHSVQSAHTVQTYAAPSTMNYMHAAPQVRMVQERPVTTVHHSGIVSRDLPMDAAHPEGFDPTPKVREFQESQEHVVEVPSILIKEKIKEIKNVYDAPMRKQKLTSHNVRKVVKEVIVPVTEVIEVQQVKEIALYQDVEGAHKTQTIPVEIVTMREKVLEVPREKRVILNVPQYREKQVPVQAVMEHEHLVEVPKVHVEEFIKQVAKPELQTIQKTIETKVYEVHERQVPIPHVTTKESIVEVPHVEQVHIVKQHARVRVEQVVKEIPRQQIEYKEKVVEVPQIIYEEHIIEVPQIEIREVVKQVAQTQVQFIDKIVQVKVPKYVDRIVEVPCMMTEERGVCVPQIQHIEALTHTPKFSVQRINKEIPVEKVMIQERIVEHEINLTHEVAVEQHGVMTAEYRVQVPVHSFQDVDKQVPVPQIHPEEQIIEVPHVLVHEQLRLDPREETVELKRQTGAPYYKEYYKPVPKVEVHAVTRTVIKEVMLEEEHPIEVPKIHQIEVLHQQPDKKVQKLIQTRVASHIEAVDIEKTQVHGQHLGEYRGHQTIVAGHHHQTKTRGLGDDDEPAARRVETAGEVKTVHLHYDKYEDFLRPVPLFMSGQGSVVEPPLYTEKYLRALNGQEVREHADKIYITIGQELIGSKVPQSDMELVKWILTAQARLYSHLGEGKTKQISTQFVNMQGYLIPIHDDSTIQHMSSHERNGYAKFLYETLSKQGIGLERVPPSDAAIAGWIKQVQGTHLQKYIMQSGQSVTEASIQARPVQQISTMQQIQSVFRR